MQIAKTGQKVSLADIQNALSTAGANDKTEIRASSKELYTKGKLTDVTLGKEARSQRQAEAKAFIGRAVDQEFAGMIPHYAAAVKRNMADIFNGSGALTKVDVDRIAAEVDRVKDVRSQMKRSEGSDLIVRSAAFNTGQMNFQELLTPVPTDYLDALETYVDILRDVNQLLSEKNALASPSAAMFKGSSARKANADVALPMLTPQKEKALEGGLQKLGALKVFMDNERYEAVDLAVLKRAAETMDCAAQCGASSINVLPQAVVLNQIGSLSDQQGRCLPLVALAAVAESRAEAGMDSLVGRLRQEVDKTDVREPTSYSQDLADMHVGGITSNYFTAVQQLPSNGHRDVVDHLVKNVRMGASTESCFYGIETGAHIMLVGLTKNDGVDSFMFYDPNFGVVRFDSDDKLKGFLDKFFGSELGYGDDYNMKELGGTSGYAFSKVSQIDVGGIAGDKDLKVAKMVDRLGKPESDSTSDPKPSSSQ